MLCCKHYLTFGIIHIPFCRVRQPSLRGFVGSFWEYVSILPETVQRSLSKLSIVRFRPIFLCFLIFIFISLIRQTNFMEVNNFDALSDKAGEFKKHFAARRSLHTCLVITRRFGCHTQFLQNV